MSNQPSCPVPACTGQVFPLTRGVVACNGNEPHSNEVIRAYFSEGLGEFGADDLDHRLDPYGWRMDMIDKASNPEPGGVSTPPAETREMPPSWPTGLGGGGVNPILNAYRGVTVLSGKSSSGKTASAVPSALGAACGGWRVMYIAAEGVPVVGSRADQWCRHQGLDEWPEDFHLKWVDGVLTPDRLVKAVRDFATTNRTLIVVDSINSLVDGIEGSSLSDTTSRVTRLGMWMMRVRQFTRGEVSFLIISEANAAGESKGRALDHKADLSVSFRKHEDDPACKEVHVVKAWWGIPGLVGRYGYSPTRACLWPDFDVTGSDADAADEPAFGTDRRWN